MAETNTDRISFLPPEGGSIDAELLDVEIGSQVTVRVRMAPQQWKRAVDGETLLGEDAAAIDPRTPPSVPVEVHLQFDHVTDDDVTAETIRDRFADPDDSICRTDAWRVIDVQRDLTSISTEELVDDALGGTYRVHPDGEYDGDIPEDSLLSSVLEHLEADDWPYTVVETESDTFVRTAIEFPDGNGWDIAVHVEEELERCTIYSTFPDPVSPDRLPEIGELLVTENYDYIDSAFEIEPASAEVSFRTIVRPTIESFGDALLENVWGMKAVHEDLEELTTPR